MKKVLPLALLLLITTTGCETEEPIQLADGSHTVMSAWQGRWLVINYWAEWCGPCRDEIPELNELHEDRDDDIVVLGVNYDALLPPKLNEVMARMDIEFPVLLEDPQPRFGYPRAEQLPMTVMINPHGQVHEVLIGPQTADSLEAAMD